MDSPARQISQRGNGRRRVFFDDPDHLLYLDLLRERWRNAGLVLWACCLMPNHVHLVGVPASGGSLARALGRRHASFARHFSLRRRLPARKSPAAAGPRPFPRGRVYAELRRIRMKHFFALAGAVLLLAAAGCAQSPAAKESLTVNGKTITIKYSSPRVNGRAGKLFGKDGRIGQDSTYPVWRAGANEATKLTSDADLTIGSLAVPKGSHTLYVDISDPDAWVLIVNKQTGQGGHSYEKSRDLGRVKMDMSKPPSLVENLRYTLANEGGNKVKLTLAWENHVASVPVVVK